MSRDKIKEAARKRQAETGEPYTLARRMVIAEHQAAQAARTIEGDYAVIPPASEPAGTGRVILHRAEGSQS